MEGKKEKVVLPSLEDLYEEGQRNQFIERSKEQFLKASSGMDDFGWDFVAEESGVTITSTSIPGSSVKCTKGEALIKGSLEDIYLLVSDIENWKTWDPRVTESRVVKEISSSHRINYLQYQGAFPVGTRDVLFLQSTIEGGPRERFVLWSSIRDDQLPGKSGVTRAQFTSSGFAIREDLGSRNCLVTFVLQFDLKGWVPASVMNAVAISQPMVLHQVDLAVQKINQEKKKGGLEKEKKTEDEFVFRKNKSVTNASLPSFSSTSSISSSSPSFSLSPSCSPEETLSVNTTSSDSSTSTSTPNSASENNTPNGADPSLNHGDKPLQRNLSLCLKDTQLVDEKSQRPLTPQTDSRKGLKLTGFLPFKKGDDKKKGCKTPKISPH
eukprot:TRINITY_DN3080_c0_g1_i1.p1 TRINITY_DN3080_c0_g1~~TRINITY_DN3080_c0_g1_i1.p1  ORF type:complete len:381 (+),score=75.91 TRINITY_DN3080_c0_g1_i1:76-1218(+)